MLTLKKIKASEITISKGTPSIECKSCYSVSDSKMVIPAEEWVQAAHCCGWREVETPLIILPAVCPDCIFELEQLENDIEAAATGERQIA